MRKLEQYWCSWLCAFISELCLYISAAPLDIHFVSNNPLFVESALHMLKMEVRMQDRIRFYCSEDGSEQSVIYRVDEQSALSCRIPPSLEDSIVGSCKNANDSVIIRLRERAILPRELSYEPNQDYFFITTSDGTANGFKRLEGGLCMTHNMRLHVHVMPGLGSAKTGTKSRTDTPTAHHFDTNWPFDGNSSKKSLIPMMLPYPVDNRLPVIYVPASEIKRLYGHRVLTEHGSVSQISGDGEAAKDGLPFRSYPVFVPRDSIFHSNSAEKEDENRFDASDDPDAKRSGSRAADVHLDSHLASSLADSGALISDGHSDTKDFEIEYVDHFSGGSTTRLRFGLKLAIFGLSAVTASLLR